MAKPSKKTHLINLFKWRSWAALIACIITIVFSSLALAYGIITEVEERISGEFQWFTVDANCLCIFAALMITPYAIEGIAKKRFTYPRWMLLIHYAGTICATLIFVFIMSFASWYDPKLAFDGENFFLHVICPIAVLLSFFMVEGNHRLYKKDTLIAMIPFFIYSIFYLINVAVLKRWDDHYQLNTLVPAYVSFPLMYQLTWIIGSVIRSVYNRLSDRREKQLRQIWGNDLDPTEIKIEIYSLGFHAGLHQEKDSVSIPFDILEDVSENFHIRLEELSKAYMAGAVNGFKEKEKEKADQ